MRNVYFALWLPTVTGAPAKVEHSIIDLIGAVALETQLLKTEHPHLIVDLVLEDHELPDYGKKGFIAHVTERCRGYLDAHEVLAV